VSVVEKIIAKVGLVGLLAILLAASLAVNVWQVKRLGAASAKCGERIAELQAKAAEAAAALESVSAQIARSTAERARSDKDRIQTDTVRYVERIREVPVPVPAECHAPMPSGVQDALRDAAAAADGRVRAR
jgi:hypothetical protein